jgi:hypothetical protein
MTFYEIVNFETFQNSVFQNKEIEGETRAKSICAISGSHR